MEFLMDRSVIRIHLKTAKKNHRMDVCSGSLKMVRNSAIIINKSFETIYYFPESFSNHEVQSRMQRNSHRTFPSLHKCIYSLNQQNQNVVLVNNKCAYAMEETDCLVKILLDLQHKYENVIDLEYDAVKNCLQGKHIVDNGQEDVRVKHTDSFESRVDSGNTKCQSQEKMNTMQKRQEVLKPGSKNKDVFSSFIPYQIFRCEAAEEIWYGDGGPASAVPLTQLSYQTNTRNLALPDFSVSNDYQTPGSSNVESFHSSILGAHEQQGTQLTFISRGRTSGSEHVNVLNYDDGIRCPEYQAYHERLSTFKKWPSDMTQKPEHVAGAGFYYTGLQDAVRCFACDGGLQNWDPEDNPWIEHCHRFPQCPFVQRKKLDETPHPPDRQQLNQRNYTDIQRENEYLRSIVTCIMCKVQLRNILFLPCTHHYFCKDCAENISLCPVCNTIVNKKIRTFMI